MINNDETRPTLWTRRTYLEVILMADGVDPFTAREAVATTALAHPELDMDEQRPFEEWLSEQDHA